MATEPNTLQEAIQYFSNPDNCLNYVVSRRWPDGVICPTCGSKEVRLISTRRLWECKTKHPKQQFSAKVSTIFEDSALGLDKWLTATWLIVGCKNGISSCEIARDLGITQKSAWHLLHRIRYALQAASFDLMSGEVEVDETFIGGKARFMHKDRNARRLRGEQKRRDRTAKPSSRQSWKGAAIRRRVVGRRRKKELHAFVKEAVEPGAAPYSDDLRSYAGLDSEYAHQVIDHAEAYVNGKIHTNGLENFWSLLKRGINGTYVSIEPFHLFCYVDEQAFRFNNRQDAKGDAGRFSLAVSQIVGKRLTWDKLTARNWSGER